MLQRLASVVHRCPLHMKVSGSVLCTDVVAERSDEGKSRVFPIVRRVKKRLASDVTLTHEYLPVLGLDSFTTSATEMLLGSESLTVLQGMEFGVHCIGSTGALRVGAEFLNSQLHYSVVYYSSPSLDKHRNVFIRAGFSVTRQFRYWKANTCTLDMEGLLNDLGAAPKNSVVLLQVCGHNPTGIDPTKTEWAQIADVMEKQQLFPFFDSSSQGLASGDIEADAWPVRYFANRGFEFMKEWLNNMSKRIIEMRQGLQDSLERLGTPGKWNHFTIQKGIFSYTELTRKSNRANMIDVKIF
ncbi:hypothetical protein C0J52_27040 [Blattella germanica]|nr:hypothetical protein C0J52_27040 [Blattella germanica]